MVKGKATSGYNGQACPCGKNDEGDIAIIVAGKPYVFELKATIKLDLPQFWREACVEAVNYANARNLDAVPPAYVIIKRRQHGIEDAWVVQTLDQWTRIVNE